jgi:MFS transporter, DHA1 family, inner membrane transport protein
MAFFGNDAINRVNLHSGVQAFAQSAGGIFILAFLLKAGLSIPATLLAFAAILAGRFALRPAILPLARRFGLKPMVIIGALGIACQYPLLPWVHGIGWPLAALCLVSSAGEVFYWASYHAYFAVLGDAEHRGQQIGAREALVAVIGVVAPLAGAWAITTLGPGPAFWAVGLAQALAVVPLIGTPNVPVARTAGPTLRAAWPGVLLQAADGWLGACFYYFWQIALFVSLGRSLSAYGGAMALAALVGAVSGLALGRHIDLGHGRRAVLIAYGAAAAVATLRAASVGSPALAVAANALGPLVGALVSAAMMTVLYNLAQAAPCPLRFQIATEGGWDLGALTGTLAAAALIAAGQSLAAPLLLALVPIAISTRLLWRRYPAI